MGVYKRYFPENHIAYKAFRDDPEANPLPSPSGKIEIYSPRLAELAETWTLLPGQAITALPEYIPNPEGAISPERKEWPLQLIGHHYKQRTHSTYGNCWWLQEVAPQELWINPIDAKARGIEFGDRVKVFNGARRFLRQSQDHAPHHAGRGVTSRRRMAYTQRRRGRHQRLRQRADQASPDSPGQGEPSPHQSRAGGKSVTAPEGRPLLRAAVSQAKKRTDS